MGEKRGLILAECPMRNVEEAVGLENPHLSIIIEKKIKKKKQGAKNESD